MTFSAIGGRVYLGSRLLIVDSVDEIPTGEPLILIGKSIPGAIGFELQLCIRVRNKVLVFPR